jgi:hypothetical protein
VGFEVVSGCGWNWIVLMSRKGRAGHGPDVTRSKLWGEWDEKGRDGMNRSCILGPHYCIYCAGLFSALMSL